MLAMAEETVRSWKREAVAPALPAHLRRRSARASHGTYLRRRVVAAVVLTVLVLAAWAAASNLAGSALGAPEPSRPMTPIAAPTHVVQPGETFWSIARRLRPEGDARPLVDRLVRAHGGTDLQVGEVIALPSTTDG